MQNETVSSSSHFRRWKTAMGISEFAPTLAELQYGEGFIHPAENPDPAKETLKTSRKSRSLESAEEFELNLSDTWQYVEAKARYYRNLGFHSNRVMPPPESLPGGPITVKELSYNQRKAKRKWRIKIAQRVFSGERI